MSDLFVLLHGMLFTNIQLDGFQATLARFMERLEIEGAEEREWIMMGIINLCAVLEYGKPEGLVRRAWSYGTREPGPGVRVMAKRAEEESKMDVDDGRNEEDITRTPAVNGVPQSPAMSTASSVASGAARRSARLEASEKSTATRMGWKTDVVFGTSCIFNSATVIGAS